MYSSWSKYKEPIRKEVNCEDNSKLENNNKSLKILFWTSIQIKEWITFE